MNNQEFVKPKEKNVMMLINDVGKTFRDRMRYKSEICGIADCYRPILMMLRFHNGCTQSELVEWTHLKAPTISLTLQKMEQLSLIERKENELDKRIVNIYIAPAGLEMDETMRSLIKETETEFLKDIDNKDLKFVEEILRKILLNAGYNGGCCK